MDLDVTATLQLAEFARLVVSAQYANLAALAWLFWDVVSTLPDEIRFVWTRRFTLPAICYVVVRYMPVVYEVITVAISLNTPLIPQRWQSSISICRALYLAPPVIAIVQTALTHSVLAYRLHAMYQEPLMLATTMLIVWLNIALMVLLLVINGEPCPVAVGGEWGSFTACSLSPAFSGHLWTIWIPAVVSECILFGLAVHRSLKVVGASDPLRLESSSLMTCVIGGSLHYFVVAIVVELGNLVSWNVWPSTPVFLFPLSITTLSIISARLFMDLRKALTKLQGP